MSKPNRTVAKFREKNPRASSPTPHNDTALQEIMAKVQSGAWTPEQGAAAAQALQQTFHMTLTKDEHVLLLKALRDAIDYWAAPNENLTKKETAQMEADYTAARLLHVKLNSI